MQLQSVFNCFTFIKTLTLNIILRFYGLNYIQTTQIIVKKYTHWLSFVHFIKMRSNFKPCPHRFLFKTNKTRAKTEIYSQTITNRSYTFILMRANRSVHKKRPFFTTIKWEWVTSSKRIGQRIKRKRSV